MSGTTDDLPDDIRRELAARGPTRMTRASDAAGPLFTEDELFRTLLLMEEPEVAKELTRSWMEHGTGDRQLWSANVLLMVALAFPDRAERIRKHLGYSTEQMTTELANAKGFFRKEV